MAEYRFPEYLYDKILFVEKQGLWPVLEASGLAERYDLGIVAGEGYATEACRKLFSQAEKGNYRLFVVHDADPYGYNIARTLREETSRMPGYHVEVNDFGLGVEDGVGWGLDSESFTRRKALPEKLALNELEQEWFTGRQVAFGKKPAWICQRIELNAFTSPELVQFIDGKLQEYDATDKILPPKSVIRRQSLGIADLSARATIRQIIERAIDVDGIMDAVMAELGPSVKKVVRQKVTERRVGEMLARSPSAWWRTCVDSESQLVLSSLLYDHLKKASLAELEKRLNDGKR